VRRGGDRRARRQIVNRSSSARHLGKVALTGGDAGGRGRHSATAREHPDRGLFWSARPPMMTPTPIAT